MKICEKCGQSLAEEITVCPSCGREVGEGRKYIDDYRIEQVLHEGHASILCRAVKEGETEPVMIRIFTSQSGVSKKVADRFKRELEELKKLPAEGFVSHQEIKRSSEGLWYRVSEWVEAENWGDVMRSGRLSDYRVAFKLFSKIASILAELHQTGHFIPHLILNDIMVFRDERGEYQVKIDYKLSRFIDPKLDRPPPLLKQLLECHPDIINERPLDFRSDIWSLGKIFIELLTASYETCDYLTKVDELPLPDEAAVLLRTMLAGDPDLRPRAMSEVAESFARITGREIEKAQKRKAELTPPSVGAIRRIRKRYRLLAAAVVVLFLVIIASWLHLNLRDQDSSIILEEYANQYAKSIAFVLVEYWLRVDEQKVYMNRAEGTAFLVDREGYLITNRHVACPWLEDKTLFSAIQQIRQVGKSPVFDYRMYLWFEGEKAFNRSASLIEKPDLEDIYFVESAFKSNGTPRLTIAGVAKPLVRVRELVASPLRDDFAVLRIDPVPRDLMPLPLDKELETRSIAKLTPIITLGFPLGSRTQEASINASVVKGHVRRSFTNVLQIDAAIYGGNSGGPVIDSRGKVIGIASGVAVDRAPGILPISTPLWNIAMVLPITKAVGFLRELREGRVKWNGVLDLSIEAKLGQIREKGIEGRWAEAMRLADKELQLSPEPSLIMAAGMMHFCAGDHRGARELFGQSLSMDDGNTLAKLMTFVIDWLSGRSTANPYREEFLTLDWRSPFEFQGYLVRVLEGMVDENSALKGWDNEAERGWLHYVIGLISAQRGQWNESEKLLRETVLGAGTDAWTFLLAIAKLEQVQKSRTELIQSETDWQKYQKEIADFERSVKDVRAAKESRTEKLAELQDTLAEGSGSPTSMRQTFGKMLEVAPHDVDFLVSMAFYSAMEGDWPEAIAQAHRFLKREGRESAGRLRSGLLEAQVLQRMGRKEEARAGLERFARRTRDPWYRSLSEGLLGKRTEASLREEAGNSPEKLITLHSALGLWAEGSENEEKAIGHYKEAIESLLDTWLEFGLARERIKSMRQS